MRRFISLSVSSLATCFLVAACSSSSGAPAGPAEPPLPPANCRAPSALPPGPWFTDITDEIGLSNVQAIRVVAGDLDGDGLPDLVFHWNGTARDAPPAVPLKRIFMNRGGTHFEETTMQSGIFDSRDGPGTGRLSLLAVLADVDNDGDLDIVDGTYIDVNTDATAAAKDRTEIFLNDGKGHFSYADRSGPSHLALPTTGLAFSDYDRDGIVDLFVGTLTVDGSGALEGAGEYLYQGQGDGSFVDVSKASHVLRPETNDDDASLLAGTNRKPSYGITVCDIDDDGDPDLIVSTYGRGYNELWRNDNGVFTEIAQGTPVASDDDIDYKPDNEFYHCYCKTTAPAGTCTADDMDPKIDCTAGSWSWQPGIDDQPARNAGNTFTTACADLDNDGDLDLIHADIKHWHIGNSADGSQIVRNDLANGVLKFTRIPNDDKSLVQPHTAPDWNEGNMDVAAFDVDNDGRKDIYLASSDYPDTWGLMYRQNADGTFTDVTQQFGFEHYHAHGFAAVDIDGDGDLDLIVTTSPARCTGDPKCGTTQTIRVYRNDIGSNNNFTQIRLHGKGYGFSNAAGIGAKVTVTSGGVKQVQEVSGGYGHYGQQHDTLLTFGLGQTCAIDSIEIRWPNGTNTVQTFTNVVPNHVVEFFEGDDKPKYTR